MNNKVSSIFYQKVAFKIVLKALELLDFWLEVPSRALGCQKALALSNVALSNLLQRFQSGAMQTCPSSLAAL